MHGSSAVVVVRYSYFISTADILFRTQTSLVAAVGLSKQIVLCSDITHYVGVRNQYAMMLFMSY